MATTFRTFVKLATRSAVAATLTGPLTLTAQAVHAPDTEFWNELDVSTRLNKRLTLTAPIVVRNSTSLADPQLYGFGPFVDAAINRYLTASAGYLFVGLPQTASGYRVHVPLAALTYRQSLGRVQISDRNRAEGLIGLPGNPIRYRNKLVISTALPGESWLPFLADEVFYDFSQSAWTQNRFQAGIGRTLNSRLRLDVFYLERNAHRGNPTATHAIGTTLEVKLARNTERKNLPHEEN